MIKGSNLAPRKSQFLPPGVWDTVWSRWDWTWIKRTIDLAVQQGANAVRLIGSLGILSSKVITMETYLSRQARLAQYCGSIGIKYYACGGDLRDVGNADPREVRSYPVAQATNLAAFGSDVLGFDLVNEYAAGFDSLGKAGVESLLVSTLKDIRTAATGLRLAVSDDRPPPKSAETLPAIASYIDFWDFHIYSPDVQFDVMEPLGHISGLPILIGEFGASRADGRSSVDRSQFYRRILNIQRSQPDFMGSLQWAIVDDDFGLYDESTLTLQNDIASAWASFP